MLIKNPSIFLKFWFGH